MSITKSIGKNTLGGGNSMQVDLKTYNRSTHNLSYAWRSSMGVGTLVPCLKLIGLPGDTFDIDIDTKVLTHPTVGPLFGSYKLQIDIFTAPFRLYNAMLHNNALNIGLDISKVKLPKLSYIGILDKIDDSTHLTCSSSSIFAYLGWRTSTSKNEANKTINNAVPILAYLDIFKNYYANKQENNFYYLVKSAYVETTLTNNQVVYNVTVTPPTTRSGTIEIANITLEDWNKSGEIYGTNTATGKLVWLSSKEMNQYWTPSQKGKNVLLTFSSPQEWRFEKNTKARYKNETYIQSAELNILDELREKILKAGSTQFNIEVGTNKYFLDILNGENDKLNMKDAGCGLLLKTYQSDIFNNWIKTEWVDGENGISAITAISTAGDKFTIDQLNLSKKVYDMLNRIAVSGGTYQDWVETVYTSE